MATYKKGDDETLDFGIDWSDWCTKEGVTLESSTWVVPTGIVNENEVSSDTVTAIFLSGGTIDSLYKVTNIVTATKAGGAIEAERSLNIFIVEDKYS